MNRTRASLRVDPLSYSPTMIFKPFVLSLALVGMVQPAPFAFAQEVDGSDLRREVREREQRVNKLSIEEQLKLRAAERNAAKDPAVKAALEKRNRAIQEFRAALRASMIKADPTVEPILDKVATGVRRGL
jgi:N-methylhydantoinase A/oxoprolinase/acetone carboxylase beta subunit